MYTTGLNWDGDWAELQVAGRIRFSGTGQDIKRAVFLTKANAKEWDICPDRAGRMGRKRRRTYDADGTVQCRTGYFDSEATRTGKWTRAWQPGWPGIL